MAVVVGASSLNTETEAKKPICDSEPEPPSILDECHQVISHLLPSDAELAFLFAVDTAHCPTHSFDGLHQRVQVAPLTEVYVVGQRLVGVNVDERRDGL